MRRAFLISGELSFEMRLRDTPTAEAIWARLPIEGAARLWGMEVYFDADVAAAEEEDAKVVLDFGEIAYWPAGDVVAIGFGETPISAAGEIRLTAPSNVWADCAEDLTLLAQVRPGDPIRIVRG